tara:strand:+ start:2459 stop:2800 length:342 start_codon:yes stop_codon:yes gene_type:complete
MKGFIWTYLMGFVVVIGLSTLIVNLGYQTGNLKQELHLIKKDLEDAKARETKFKADVYNGMTALINGQKILSLAQLRIHHFAEPHSDRFYPNCHECEKERQAIEKNEGTVTSK